MSIFQTIIVAIVEGLTEFLPVSSTGHMILTQALLGVQSTDFVKMFTVNIQLGAILSVVILYWRRFFQAQNIIDFYLKLLIAFLPAAVLGFAFGDYIDLLLESVLVVAIMLVLGGVLMLFVDTWFNSPSDDQAVSWQRALKIGFCQCVAMIPGVSRSMATIVGGMSTKLTRKNAAEFSFFLAVPTMAAATGYSLMKLLKNDAGRALFSENWHVLLIGNAVAFVVALLAIKFFINFLTKYGFKAFGWYRIAVGALILVLLACGVDLAIA
jgi:undecaprenyl-diphosphatase